LIFLLFGSSHFQLHYLFGNNGKEIIPQLMHALADSKTKAKEKAEEDF